MALGFGVGAIVVYAGLSSLVATLGMNFLLRGADPDRRPKASRSPLLGAQREHSPTRSFRATSAAFRLQMLWALLFVVVSIFLYNRHRFGVRVHAVGDNPDSAAQMGIDTGRVRVIDLRLHGARRGAGRRLLDHDQLHLVADVGRCAICCRRSPRSSSAARRPGAGSARSSAVRIGAVIVSFIQTGIVGGGLVRLLRPVLQRADHHSVAARPPLEPDPIPLMSGARRGAQRRTSLASTLPTGMPSV